MTRIIFVVAVVTLFMTTCSIHTIEACRWAKDNGHKAAKELPCHW